MIYNMNKKRLQELAGINVNKELLSEEGMYYNPRNNNYLYHYTDIASMYMICLDNLILKPGHLFYKDGIKDFISFTRDKYLNFGKVCIVIDKNKLSEKYKITPYDDSIINSDIGSRTESEERIKDYVDIKNSIVKVGFYINEEIKKIYDTKKRFKHILIYTLDYLKKRKIPFNIYSDIYNIEGKYDEYDRFFRDKNYFNL